MRFYWKEILAGMALSVWTGPATAQGIRLVGTGTIAGNSTDLSGLMGNVPQGTGTVPQNQLGTFGSGIAYTGSRNLYVAVNDRGPGDGSPGSSYLDRIQIMELTVDPVTKTLTPRLVDTRLLRSETGANLVGQATAFSMDAATPTLRFDPEAIRVGRNGHLFISDEYGPYIYEFDQTGRRIRSVPVPAKFSVAKPNADGNLELTGNTSGRQSSRGLEGLAISPDGSTLFALLQNPLLQDAALNTSGARAGINTRLIRIDLATGATQEFVYQLEDGVNNGVNEILAINDHEFLVIERDGRAGTAAVTKRIYRIDLTGATDVSNLGTTATNGLPGSGSAGFTAVKKTLFLDLLDPALGLAGANFPEKLEGLAFGPDLPDGSRLLIVTSDNDLLAANNSYFYAFAISPSALTGYQPQVIDAPFANVRNGQITISSTGLLYNREARTHSAVLTLTNTGTDLAGPLRLAITGLPPGATVVNATSMLDGSPAISFSDGTFPANGVVTVSVQLTNLSTTDFTLTPVFYSGNQ